ncbi:MAG: bifunctional metallophosphatase/5'-nucleotidase [Polyangia bacterium]
MPTCSRVVRVAVALAAVLAATTARVGPARAQAPDGQAPTGQATAGQATVAPAPVKQIDLIFASDLGGDFFAQDCSAPARPGQGLLALARAIRAARAERPGALVIGGGGLLGGAGGGRYLMHDITGSRTAANLLRSAGLELITPGVSDFAIARDTLPSYLDQLRGSGPAPLVSNLSCPAARPELCRMLVDRHVLTRNGLRVGVIAALPEDTAQRIGPGHLHGAVVLPWPKVTPIAKEVRPQVDVLVLELDLSSRFGLDEAVGLVRSLDAAGAHVDVVHLTRQDDAHGGLLSMRLSSGTLLVGSPGRGAGVMRVTVSRAAPTPAPAAGSTPAGPAALELRAEPVPPAGPPPPLLAEAVERSQKEMCDRWGLVMAALPPSGLDRAQVTRLVLDAMRSAAHAEIALINTGAIAERGLPLRAATVHAVGNVLPFKGQVLTATLPGQALADALGKYAEQGPGQALRMAGLVKKGDGLLVNGRPLSPTQRYRVVTIDFLAAGGNGLLPEKFLPGGGRIVQDDLRTLVLDYLRRVGEAQAPPVPLRLERRPLWSATFDLGVDLQNVTVHNPDKLYDRPQLSRQPSLAFKLDGTVRLEMDQPSHLVQLTMRGLYGQSWLYTNSPADQPDSDKEWIGQETADLINLLALYSYRGFSERRPRLPTPYVSLGLESEFNRPDTRTYHHFELSGAFGLRVALPKGISANLGIGARTELLASSESPVDTERDLARTRFLLTTTLEMPKRALWSRLGSSLLGEFLISYSFTDPELLRSHELRALGKLYIELGRPLFLTVGTELYVYRDRDKEAGVALDLTAGLKVLLTGHRQQF